MAPVHGGSHMGDAWISAAVDSATMAPWWLSRAQKAAPPSQT
jgi:hypothetical protein